jgi:diaminopimelate decarboxylase
MTVMPFSLLPDNSTVDADGMLTIGGCRVDDLALEYGTPLFIYDEAHLRARCREAVTAFGREQVVYASKAFVCGAMAQIAYSEGMLIDVASGGELAITLAAGVPASFCVLHGNNKSMSELKEAIIAGVRHIVVDSFDEIERLEALHSVTGRTPDVMIRVTPGVHVHTHEFIATGQDDSKFGFNLRRGDAAAAVAQVQASPAMNLIGVHCHIGSNVFDAENFARAVEVMSEFAEPLGLPHLVLGGGLGVAYVEGEQAATLTEWATALLGAAADLGVQAQISVEPGRSIVASAAITVYEVGTIKAINGLRTYVAVDGGMSDNPRPVLYGSGYEAFLPRAINAERVPGYRVVGKHCESGDVLVNEALLPADVAVGDLLATAVTGAYGRSMGSNYNAITRPAVVFVADGDARLVIRRETYADLISTDLVANRRGAI